MTTGPLADFHLAPASAFFGRSSFARYQDLRESTRWFANGEQPLCIVFVSHRWETLEHPDPTGRQLRALQRLLDLVVRCTAACLLPRAERDVLMPPLDREGTLQALTIALRMLDLEPSPFALRAGPERRGEVVARAAALGPSSEGFAAWLKAQIAVWVDYSCVPQAPRGAAESDELRATLARLDELLRVATVVSLRHPADGYSDSGWCVTECALANRSPEGHAGFARNLYVDLIALNDGAPLYMPTSVVYGPAPSAEALGVMDDTYAQARRGLDSDLARLVTDELPWVQSSPPRLWSAYQDVISGSFHRREADPNPLRRSLELALSLGEQLVRTWLLASGPVEIDLASVIETLFARAGLRCSRPEDRVYLGLLLGRAVRAPELRPLIGDALTRNLASRSERADRTALRVRLSPSTPRARALLASAQRASPEAWYASLSLGPTTTDEARVVAALREELTTCPLVYELA